MCVRVVSSLSFACIAAEAESRPTFSPTHILLIQNWPRSGTTHYRHYHWYRFFHSRFAIETEIRGVRRPTVQVWRHHAFLTHVPFESPYKCGSLAFWTAGQRFENNFERNRRSTWTGGKRFSSRGSRSNYARPIWNSKFAQLNEWRLCLWLVGYSAVHSHHQEVSYSRFARAST